MLKATPRQMYDVGIDLVGFAETPKLELQCGSRQNAEELR